MSRWNYAVTEQGQALLAGLAGKTLKITKAVCGKAAATDPLESLTQLTDYAMDIAITDNTSDGATAKMRFTLDNTAVTQRFNLYQIGVYAKSYAEKADPAPDDSGILLQVWQTNLPDIVYSNAESPGTVRDYLGSVDVGNASSVDIPVDPAAYVRYTRFHEVELLVDQHTQQFQNLIVEMGTVNLANTKQYPFNDSAVSINLTTPRKNLNYMVHAEAVSSNGSVESVEVYDKQINGFKIRFSGSAASAQINYFVSGGMQS
nr:hypothetical protein [uncultured Caproiciproducens sp.]